MAKGHETGEVQSHTLPYNTSCTAAPPPSQPHHTTTTPESACVTVCLCSPGAARFMVFVFCTTAGLAAEGVRSRRNALSHKYCANDTSMARQRWFAEVLFVGCSDPLFGQLADSLPPTGTGVLHACSSISSLCCTWVTWPNRDVIHSDTLRKRSASSLVESWCSGVGSVAAGSDAGACCTG